MSTSPDPARRDAPDGAHAADEPTTSGTPVGRRSTVREQKEQYGGIKWGSAFFGWLTATGTSLILTALAAALGTAFGLAGTPGDAGQAIEQAGQAVQNSRTAQTAGVVTAIVVLVILLVAYYAGGYVAGRMARFNGVKQGVAVWLWAVVIAVIVAILAAVAGSRFNILANLNGLPRIPIGEGTLTAAGIITAVIALVAALVGAILGGLAGMRFHRKVDRVGYDY